MTTKPDHTHYGEWGEPVTPEAEAFEARVAKALGCEDHGLLCEDWSDSLPGDEEFGLATLAERILDDVQDGALPLADLATCFGADPAQPAETQARQVADALWEGWSREVQADYNDMVRSANYAIYGR